MSRFWRVGDELTVTDGVKVLSETGGPMLRDLFAAHALAGLMAAPDYDGTPRDAAKLSYQLADAMLVAREQRA